ncbi:MAG: pyridoxal phosphate-dependent aminotransferase [Armatimonadetes bacterium]|nr:pyridoxal phosphate-dependent aminotransferase [Armatimonadota bacterium]
MTALSDLKLAERMTGLGTETAFEVLARARELERSGKSIVHLEIGEPDFDTPAHIKEAAIRALHDGFTHYTPSAGLYEAREAVAEYIEVTRGIPVDPDEVVITPGSKPVMFFAILALVNPGDEVIVPNPGYPIYESVARFVGGVAKPLVLREERDFRVDPEALRRLMTPKTRLVVLNSPHNPCGSVLTRNDIEAIAEIVARSNAMVLADEIYWQIMYDSTHTSIASLPGMKDRTIILDGFSKAYAMTGWRLGFGIMRKDLAAKMAQLMVNSNSCAAAFSQIAGIAALRGPHEPVKKMVAEFRRRRDVIVAGLNAIEGVNCAVPAGAFYAFPNVMQVDRDSKRLADFLLSEGGVACLSGTAFGEHGRGYLRFSYANNVEKIEEGLRRMKEALKRYRAAVS